MAIKDKVLLGMSLPHRAPERIGIATVRHVAERAEELNFSELWVTENTLDHAFSFDPSLLLTYAATYTKRIRLGVAVVVLPVRNPSHVANTYATLDYLSGGRAVLGVGIGREQQYKEFQIPLKQRVRRFRESLAVIDALWTQESVTYQGEFYQLTGEGMTLKPVQKPRPPIWIGGRHPNAVRRAAQLGDGWIAAGGSGNQAFATSVKILHDELQKQGKSAATFPISKRVFISVDDRYDVAKAEMDRWFRVVYRRSHGVSADEVFGTPAQVQEQLESLVDAGANHLLLNPVCRYAEQVEALAEVVGLK